MAAASSSSRTRWPRPAAVANVDTIINGHIPVGTINDLKDYAAFTRDFVDFARASMKAGKTVEQAAAEYKVAPRFKGYVASLNPAFGGAAGKPENRLSGTAEEVGLLQSSSREPHPAGGVERSERPRRRGPPSHKEAYAEVHARLLDLRARDRRRCADRRSCARHGRSSRTSTDERLHHRQARDAAARPAARQARRHTVSSESRAVDATGRCAAGADPRTCRSRCRSGNSRGRHPDRRDRFER